MHITYLQATTDHIAEVMAGLRSFTLEFWGELSPELLESLRENHESYFPEALKNRECVFWLAKRAEEFAGIGGMIVRKQPGTARNPSGRIGYIFGMYTVPQYRRNGICLAILQQLEACAKTMNIGMLELHASKDGEPVYIRQGFLQHNEPTYRKFSADFI
jgi:hypothetical protein